MSERTLPGDNDQGRRREDHDWVARMFNWFVKFHWLATIIFAFFLMLGFGFETPQASFQRINERIARNWALDSVRFIELDKQTQETEKEREELRELVEALVIVQCRNNFRLAQDNRLPCRRLFREWGLE